VRAEQQKTMGKAMSHPRAKGAGSLVLPAGTLPQLALFSLTIVSQSDAGPSAVGVDELDTGLLEGASYREIIRRGE
jgi:hypothetical protein